MLMLEETFKRMTFNYFSSTVNHSCDLVVMKIKALVMDVVTNTHSVLNDFVTCMPMFSPPFRLGEILQLYDS